MSNKCVRHAFSVSNRSKRVEYTGDRLCVLEIVGDLRGEPRDAIRGLQAKRRRIFAVRSTRGWSLAATVAPRVLSLSLSLSRARFLSLCLPLPLSLSFALSLSLYRSLARSLSLTLSLSLPLPFSLSLSLLVAPPILLLALDPSLAPPPKKMAHTRQSQPDSASERTCKN